jgi:hypothetical protein
VTITEADRTNPMTELERIAVELGQAHSGHPWHGPSRATVLADVTVEEAARRPSKNAHSIWALVLHMSAWTGEVARRLREGDAREPVEGDWPSPSTPSAQAWRDAITALEQAHRPRCAPAHPRGSTSAVEAAIRRSARR